ncbi:MAG: hypothetical protein EU529_12170 [Promethearchaeota archaeon]|nr:MAG: hypothetical protein EU529_12170 [Candidatus Lokiarchaeota archaeon]
MTKSNPKKIIFIGLDNAGKTSIVKCLSGTKKLDSFCEIKPTKGNEIISIKISDSEFNIWDLGGQESFRKEYLSDFDRYIFGCNKLIFVFDIQDSKRYELALQYFEKIINLLEDNIKNNNIKISIFLHKFDSDLIKTDAFNKKITSLKDKIKEKLDSTDFFYQIFNTTIYAIFEKRVTE